MMVRVWRFSRRGVKVTCHKKKIFLGVGLWKTPEKLVIGQVCACGERPSDHAGVEAGAPEILSPGSALTIATVSKLTVITWVFRVDVRS